MEFIKEGLLVSGGLLKRELIKEGVLSGFFYRGSILKRQTKRGCNNEGAI